MPKFVSGTVKSHVYIGSSQISFPGQVGTADTCKHVQLPAIVVHERARAATSLAVEVQRPSIASVRKPQVSLHLNYFTAGCLHARVSKVTF